MAGLAPAIRVLLDRGGRDARPGMVAGV